LGKKFDLRLYVEFPEADYTDGDRCRSCGEDEKGHGWQTLPAKDGNEYHKNSPDNQEADTELDES
jgi:hypothetical protein